MSVTRRATGHRTVYGWMDGCVDFSVSRYFVLPYSCDRTANGVTLHARARARSLASPSTLFCISQRDTRLRQDDPENFSLFFNEREAREKCAD